MIRYKILACGLNSYSMNSWKDAIWSCWGGLTEDFCLLVIGQYARCDGRVYPDFSREEKGYLNPEKVCSVVADRRNDRAIRACSKLMEDPRISRAVDNRVERFGPLETCDGMLRRSDEDGDMIPVICSCILKMHQTLQQNMVRAAFSILRDLGYGEFPALPMA